MKYIRTRERIYEDEEYWKRPPIEIMDINKEIIDQADTIKELCDEYIIYDSARSTYSICSKKDWEMKTEELKDHILKTRTVYGAIWTNNGLIYAAKMKENKELELL